MQVADADKMGRREASSGKGWFVRERESVERLSSNFPLLDRAFELLLNRETCPARGRIRLFIRSASVKTEDEKQRIRSSRKWMEGEREGRSLLNGRVMPAANHVCGVDEGKRERRERAGLLTHNVRWTDSGGELV